MSISVRDARVQVELIVCSRKYARFFRSLVWPTTNLKHQLNIGTKPVYRFETLGGEGHKLRPEVNLNLTPF